MSTSILVFYGSYRSDRIGIRLAQRACEVDTSDNARDSDAWKWEHLKHASQGASTVRQFLFPYSPV
jgi:hypothetical protein